MRALALMLFLSLTTNGLAMLGWPLWWYLHLPGVVETGAFNAHFVRDIGAAYLVCGLCFGVLRLLDDAAKAAAWAACGFLLLHGAIHLVETLAGVTTLRHFLRDVPAVMLLPLIAVFCVRAYPARTRPANPLGDADA